MANSVLDRYGIKEVADVVFYKIENGKPSKPVLVLDTLKVSTVEQTAETTDARGGKGNAKLISWDYNKEINVTLEDALYSPKSMSIMFGNEGQIPTATTRTLLKTIAFTASSDGATGVPTTWEHANGAAVAISGTSKIFDEAGLLVDPSAVQNGHKYFLSFNVTGNGTLIEINASKFPGTYYIVGDTFARPEDGGDDQYFQFIIPKAKVSAENTITLEAEGDPSVFNLNLTVLRPADGKMMKLIQYDVAAGNSSNSESEIYDVADLINANPATT